MPSKPPRIRPAGQVSRQQQRRMYDRRRDTQEYRRWYKTARWQERRAQQLAEEPLCTICLKHNRITRATVADHVEMHNGDYDKFWFGQLQSLCDEPPWRCHSSVKQKEEARCR